MLFWITSFITNRLQIIKYKNFLSNPIHISPGVSQESHLSLLLFNIFINNISINLRFAKLFTFADDNKLLSNIKSVNGSYLSQEDINAV